MNEEKTTESVISVDEIQKTIRMDIEAGKVSKDAVRQLQSRSPSTRASRTTTSILRDGLVYLKYFFSNPESSNDLINGDTLKDFDSLSSVMEAENKNFENLELRLIDEDFQQEGIFASGGQANIINAKDKQIGRGVAIKCLREDCKDNLSARLNLMQEATLTARLEHPSIIPV